MSSAGRRRMGAGMSEVLAGICDLAGIAALYYHFRIAQPGSTAQGLAAVLAAGFFGATMLHTVLAPA